MDRDRWPNTPQEFLDLEFANVPMISIDNPTANTIQEKMRKATANCLFAETCRYCSLDQTQMQPPSKFAITWASVKRVIAAHPSLKA